MIMWLGYPVEYENIFQFQFGIPKLNKIHLNQSIVTPVQ